MEQKANGLELEVGEAVGELVTQKFCLRSSRGTQDATLLCHGLLNRVRKTQGYDG